MIMDTNAVKSIIPVKITPEELNIDQLERETDDLLNDILGISIEEWEEACTDGILFY